MKKDLDFNRPSDSEKLNEPKVIGKVLNKYFHSNEPLAVAYRKHLQSTTELGIDLKLMTREPGRMKPGKNYQGVLRRDVECEEFRYDEHFTFVETLPAPTKRNPRLYNGKYVTITLGSDGFPRPNLKPIKDWTKFNVDEFANTVRNELRNELIYLIEK